jgi:uncharacterized protein YjbI with pentapeptide repeats
MKKLIQVLIVCGLFLVIVETASGETTGKDNDCTITNKKIGGQGRTKGFEKFKKFHVGKGNFRKCKFCDLSGLDLSGLDLRGKDLSGSDLRNANLTGANLSKARLFEVKLCGANLTGANLSNLRAPNGNWTGANLTGANLDNAYFSGSDLSNVNFTNAKISKSEEKAFNKVIIKNANFSGTPIEKARKKLIVGEKAAEAAAAKAETEAEEQKANKEKQLAEVKSGKEIMDQQKRFIEIVSTHADKYKKAKNDIKKSITRKKRVAALKSLFGGKNTLIKEVKAISEYECHEYQNGLQEIIIANRLNPVYAANLVEQRCKGNPTKLVAKKHVRIGSDFWVGTLSKITTDKDGDATVYINLDNNIKIRNTTGISSSSSMYEQLGELEEGKKIIFNGYLNLHSEGLTTGYFLSTIALTERGALIDPEFDFTFTKIHTN